jgi:hypothetical protein
VAQALAFKHKANTRVFLIPLCFRMLAAKNIKLFQLQSKVAL